MDWKDVKEPPAERMAPVLLFNGTAPLYNQHVFAGCWFSQTQRFVPDDNHKYMGEITHWMPLPKPPTESLPEQSPDSNQTEI
jgi:hypothetical protein